MKEALIEDVTISLPGQARRAGVGEQEDGNKEVTLVSGALTSGISGSAPGQKVPLRTKVKPQRKRKG